MYCRFFLIFLLSTSTFLNSQTKPNYGDLDSHTYFIEQLNNSKETNFNKVVSLYDHYINENPLEISARVERCKFIGNSYYDEYEDYNLKYDETNACIAELYNKYPSNPKVLIYRAENLYGEERINALNEAFYLMSKDLKKWSDYEKAAINEMLGNHYLYSENRRPALKYFKAANNYNEELDLSISMAEIYMEGNNNELATEILLNHLEKDTLAWSLNAKAKLLLKLGNTKKALSLFNTVQNKDSTLINNEEMAKAMLDLKKYDIARDFLIKDTIGQWNKLRKLVNLFDHDLSYSTPGIALKTYREIHKENTYSDFLAINRLRIFFKNPFLSWNISELLQLLVLLVSFVALIVLPYIWVLPVFNIGIFLKKKGKVITPLLNFKWGLKHFWIISSVYLMGQYLASLAFYYQDYINIFLETSPFYDEVSDSQDVIAKAMLSYVLLMTVGTLLVLKKGTFRNLFTSKVSLWRSIKFIGGILVFNIFFAYFLKKITGYDDYALIQSVLSAKAEIMAILQEYGFVMAVLSIAILVPIYEETIFRGVILGSVEKHLGFVSANIIQAFLFAAIHFNFKLFLYYFVFGIITGYYAKKSGGLLNGILLHMLTNFLALTVINFILKMNYNPLF